MSFANRLFYYFCSFPTLLSKKTFKIFPLDPILKFSCLFAFNLLTLYSVFKVHHSPPPSLSQVVGSNGLEPSTSCLSGTRSNHLSYEPMATSSGGDKEIRTLDPLLAGQVLSQLSYTPILGYHPTSLCLVSSFNVLSGTEN